MNSSDELGWISRLELILSEEEFELERLRRQNRRHVLVNLRKWRALFELEREVEDDLRRKVEILSLRDLLPWKYFWADWIDERLFTDAVAFADAERANFVVVNKLAVLYKSLWKKLIWIFEVLLKYFKLIFRSANVNLDSS